MSFLKISKNKLLKLGKAQVAVICILSVSFAAFKSSYTYLIASHYKSMVLTLNYEGAKDGLTPEGSRFNIGQVVSDEVLEDVVEKLGDDSVTVDYLKKRISIDAKMPRTAMDKTINTIKNGSAFSYAPAEFTIDYSQKDKFGENKTIEVLTLLADSYTKYFYEKYSNNNCVLEYSIDTDYSSYDYDEICRILSDRISSMITYLSHQRRENVTYISSETGYTYADLINKLNNIRDVNVEKLNAYIMRNNISRSKDMFLKKHQYLIDSETRNFNYVNDSSNIINSSVSIYDSGMTGVIFVPSVDAKKEYYMGRTKTGIDDLIMKAYNDGEKAVAFKKSIDSYQTSYNSFSSAAQSTAAENAVADEMIDSINRQLADVSDKAIRTDNEFIEIMTNKYLSFRIPKETKFPITYAVKMLIVGAIFSLAGCKFLEILFTAVKRTLKSRKGE